jgi:predicted cation transporter
MAIYRLARIKILVLTTPSVVTAGAGGAVGKQKIKRRTETMRKNKILWFTVKANLVVLALALSALDSESIIPVIVALVALAYLGLFNYANKEREWK